MRTIKTILLLIFVFAVGWIAVYAVNAFYAQEEKAAQVQELNALRQQATPAPTQLPQVTPTPEPAPPITEKPEQSPLPSAEPFSPVTNEPVLTPSPEPTEAIIPDPTPEITPEPEKQTEVQNQDPVLAYYGEKAKENPDLFGWLYLEGSGLDCPVMYRPQDKDYYLYTGFDHQYAIEGVPYIDERCDPFLPSDNVIIYGHNMSTGSQFTPLKKYLLETYFLENPYICFDSLTQRRVYQVYAVIPVDLGSMHSERMLCYSVDLTSTQEQVDLLWDYLEKYALYYDEEAIPEVGGKTITLSTCTGFMNADRLVIMAQAAPELSSR